MPSTVRQGSCNLHLKCDKSRPVILLLTKNENTNKRYEETTNTFCNDAAADVGKCRNSRD